VEEKAGKTERFEDLLARLEEIVAKMEGGGLSLDESLALYEEGVAKSKHLNEMLSAAREKVMKLVGNGEGGPALEPFEDGDAS